MSLSSELSALLKRISKAAYERMENQPVRCLRNSVLSLSWNPGPTHNLAYYDHGMFMGQKSNHQKLGEAKFEADRISDIKTMMELLARYFPALDTPDLGFDLRLNTPASSGRARFRLHIMSCQIGGGMVQIPTLVKHLERSRRHMEGVSCSTARTFRIGDNTIMAKDPYDALRIHAALAFPGVIETPPPTTPRVQVLEVINTDPLFQALFSEAA